MDTIASFAGFLTLALILTVGYLSIQWHAVTLAGQIWRVPIPDSLRKPNFWAAAGSLIYVLTWFVSNQWQIAFWLPDYGVITREDAYGLALRLKTNAEQTRQVLYLALFFTFFIAQAKRVPSLQFRKARLPVALTFVRLSKPDLHAKLVWLILLMSEGWAELEYIQCKMLIDPIGKRDYMLSQNWGLETSVYACGRVNELSPYLAPIIATTWLLVIWLIAMRRGHDRED